MDRLGNPVESQDRTCEVRPFDSSSRGLASIPSEQEIMAFGGMQEVQVRSSDRLRMQANADSPQLDRAMDLAARKFCGTPQGTLCKSALSFCSLTSSDIQSTADRLGVSLGTNLQQQEQSISVILELEKEREVIFL